MPKEYLEREAICENCNNKDSCFPYPEMRVKCPVYKTSAADVEPIKHGEWMYDRWCEFKCSICGHWSNTFPRGKEKYCPECGARMDGGKK